MRFRVWQADATRVIPALGVDGPLVVQQGEYVLVAVVKSRQEAGEIIAKLSNRESTG